MLAVGLAGVLAVPAGVSLASTDDPTDDVDRNRVTTLARDQSQDQSRDRDRLRIHDPATCDCARRMDCAGRMAGAGRMEGAGRMAGGGHRFGAGGS